MRLNHHSCGVSMALVGLLAVCAVASEGTPSEGESVAVSLRRLSTSEVVSILDEIPDMVPGYDANAKDRASLAHLLPLSQVTAAQLEEALPEARFYKGLDVGIAPSIPYLMAIAGGKRYGEPGTVTLFLDINLPAPGALGTSATAVLARFCAAGLVVDRRVAGPTSPRLR
jgi:hypothetical protein